jgi:two-component system phosphate regulon response regulator PhoB
MILEDKVSTVKLLTPALETAGFTVSQAAYDLNLVSAARPDLIILSSRVPQSTGLDICRALRSQTATKSILIISLTLEPSPDSHVRYLEAGSDDVVAEPLSVGELLARVQARIRRSALQNEPNVLQGHGLKLDRKSHRVTRHGREVALGPTEYRLLELLMENRGRAVTRAQLIAMIWSHDAEIDDRTVDVHLGRLRRAVDKRWEPNPIRTVRGVGYVFDIEV